jgi:ferredoxin
LDETTLLRVNPIACSGHGVCAELLPELITLDEWGYPLIAAGGAVPVRLDRIARRAVTDCPALALALTSTSGGASRRRGNSEEAQMPGRAGAGKLGT